MSTTLAEINETEQLLKSATFTGVKSVLEKYLTSLRLVKQSEDAKLAQTSTAEPKDSANDIETPLSVPVPAVKKPKVASSSGTFIPIENFAWDQGSYGSSNISIFIDLDDVGSVKEKVDVKFGKSSFDLTVNDLHGKNYRLLKDNLEKDIIPEQSTFVVKKNKIVVKLQKVKGEYSYEHWSTLTAKKKKESEAAKKDPMGGMMDMMKNMYDEGDENMKKIIGEAMMKSRSGEKSAPEDFGDMKF